MQWLASLCIRQPVFTWVVMLLFLVVGAFGYASLGVDQFPNVDIPVVLVTATLNGSAPEEIETDVTDKLEGAINTINGVDELRSASSDGVSRVIVTFDMEKNTDVAAQEVRDHINNVLPELPKGIDPPVVQKLDPDSSPILFVTLASPGDIRDVTELADKVVRRQNREHQRRRRAPDPRRPQEAGQRVARPAEAAGGGAHRDRRGVRAGAAEPDRPRRGD